MTNLLIVSSFFLIFSLNSPVRYLAAILLLSLIESSFLNLIGYKVISAAVGISSIVAIIYKILIEEKVDSSGYIILMGCIVFYLYGVLIALSRSSSLIDIIFASGDFLSIFFLPYFILFSRQINEKNLTIVVVSFSLFLSIFGILAIFGFNILNFPFRPSLFSSFGIQFPFVTLIALSFLIVISNNSLKYRSAIFIILLIAIMIQGHASITLVMLGTIVIKYLHLLNIFRVFSKNLINIFAFSFFVVMMLYTSDLYLVLPEYFAEFRARENQNLFRIAAIKDNDYGLGFLPSDTDIQQRILSYSLSNHDRSLSTIDAGYINLSVIFGPYVSILYLYFLYYLITDQINSNVEKDFLIIYFLLLFGANLTLSIFSYMFGFVTLAVGLTILKLKDNHAN